MLNSITFITFITLLSGIILALPRDLLSTRQTSMDSTYSFLPSSTRCSLNSSNLLLPTNQNSLVLPPDGVNLVFTTLGRGIQNYTCASTGKWVSAGALSVLFDISCLTTSIESPLSFSSAVQIAHDTPLSVYDDYTSISSYMGLHCFVVTSETNVIEPKFDFGTVLNDPTMFIVGNKTGTIPSPDDPTTDVAWLQLASLEGSLATTVFRVETVGGTPPPSCGNPNTVDVLSIPYAAQYWFFK